MPEPTITTTSTVDGQPSSAPSRKLTWGTAASLAATIIWGVLNAYVFKDRLSPEMADAVTGMISIVTFAAVSYLVPHAPNEGISYAQTVSVPIAPPVAAAVAQPVSLQPAGGVLTGVQPNA